jgi:hypothetical protein
MRQMQAAPAPSQSFASKWDRWLYLVDQALSRPTRGHCRLLKYYIVTQPVGGGLLPGRRGDSIAVKEVLAGDPLLQALGRPENVIRDRYGQGARCLAAIKDGQFAGCIWFVVGPYEEDEVRCRFEPLPMGRRAWDFDVFIAESFRGTLVFPKLWTETSKLMQSLGVEQTVSRISAFKPESLAAHGRLGARVVARAMFLKLWPLQIALMRGGKGPRMAVSIGSAGRPVLQLDI